MGWADDPELLATFTTEVSDRLDDLSAGLQRLEIEGPSRDLVAALFRDAHTVKGSARMLGLDPVVTIAHRCEDALAAVRDQRVVLDAEGVGLLLVACTALRRGLPDASDPLQPSDVDRIVQCLDAMLAGDPFVVPTLASTASEAGADAGVRTRGEAVRVPPQRLYALLDEVGEVELRVRRGADLATSVAALLQQREQRLDVVRELLRRHAVPTEVVDAIHQVTGIHDRIGTELRDLREGIEDATAALASVRSRTMELAMVPVGRVAAGFPQLVRQVAQSEGKQVRLEVSGEDVELDSRVLDGLAEALGHLLTNAVDHGCEPPEVRRAAGKPAQATVTVAVRSAGSVVEVEVTDDGRGLDRTRLIEQAQARGLLAEDDRPSDGAVAALMFHPGLSTRTDVTVSSGRGVGLHAVRSAVEELGGTIDVEPGDPWGLRFRLTVPVTLGVMRCLLARVGTERYALPLSGIVETVAVDRGRLDRLAGAPVLMRDDEAVPVVDLGTALGVDGERDPRAGVLVRTGAESSVWLVDALDGEVEVVVKELGAFLGRPAGLSGATIAGDGEVLLLIDLRELSARHRGSTPSLPPPQAPVRDDAASQGRPTVLVVEDSIGVRELERVVLEGAGYQVVTAVDGLEGARRLGGAPVDAVISDVEMPGMDGFALTRALRSTRGWEDVPVVIMTSRGDEADRRAGMEAGANAYLLKSEFDQHELVETVRRLVGR